MSRTSPRIPKISVVLPVYNAEIYVTSTLSTLLSQTYTDWEAIIVDGGSTDRTLALLDEYAKKDSRLRIIREKCESPYQAIWKGTQLTRSEFVYILCFSDGYLTNTWYAECMAIMEEDPEVSLVWGIPFDRFDDPERPGKEITRPHYIFGHFLRDTSQYEQGSVIKRIFRKIDLRHPISILRLIKKLNRANLVSARRILRPEEPPLKEQWFAYWLETGLIFPDGNMCVARKALLDCLPSYKGGDDMGNWEDFFFNFNTKGYLSYCIPISANFGRLNRGQISEVFSNQNDRNREKYFRRLKQFGANLKAHPEQFSFRDRAGNSITPSARVPIKLHLGSGEKYLEGYINIDFPEGEHTVMKPKADQYADIRTLAYEENSVDEIRSHHLFEHFSRTEALKLLMQWRRWLKPDGLLVIETPDFAASAAAYATSLSLKKKFELGRHIFGSQEAGWAQHKDFWDKQKFFFILKKFGFRRLQVRRYRNGLARHAEEIPFFGKILKRIPEPIYLPLLNILGRLLPKSFYRKYGSNHLPNILVRARKDGRIRLDERATVRDILFLSLVGKEGDTLLDTWLRDYENTFHD